MDEQTSNVSLEKIDPATGEIYPERAPQPSAPVTAVQPQPVQPPVQSAPAGGIVLQPLQPGMKYCAFCAGQMPQDAVLCVKCGRMVEGASAAGPSAAPPPQVVIQNTVTQTNVNAAVGVGNPKNKWVAFCLCFFLGFVGAHCFYEGKAGKGILYIFTFGLFGIGWFIDWISILTRPNPYYVRY